MVKQILVTIPTTCMDESVAFYTDILQFDVTHRYDRPGGVKLTFLNREGFTVELVSGPHIPAGDPGTGAPILTFMIRDLADIQSRLAVAQMEVPEPIDLHDGISMLRFKDPNGVIISFVSGEL